MRQIGENKLKRLQETSQQYVRPARLVGGRDWISEDELGGVIQTNLALGVDP